jgi:TolB protein
MRSRTIKMARICAVGAAVWAGTSAACWHEAARLKTNPVGMFDGHTDVGMVPVEYHDHAEYDAVKGTYTVTGSGENIWFGADSFRFAWKRMSGEVTLAADIAFTGKGINEHRKAVLMVRQSLDADAVYADVAVQGSGLTSLQFREEKGAETHEVQANGNAANRVRIDKQGNYFTMWIAGADGKFALAGATGKIALKAPFYVGIGVCSHEKGVVEKAVFSHVLLQGNPSSASLWASRGSAGENGVGSAAKPKLYSMLEIMDAGSLDRRTIYVAEGRFEAPNWMPDGKTLLFNRKGRIEKIAENGGKTELIDTGYAVQCNNDHGISPDGQELVISDQSQEEHQSRIYILPIGGGIPRRVTKNAPSYWHGWSPDGKTLAFVGQRNGDFDIYAIAAVTDAESPGGGEDREEKRLTTAKGLDDGPEYSPDGKFIYFNSERTGHMQIWRMKSDGSEQEPVTDDEYNNWFPHISPDGTRMVFLTYEASVIGHPEDKDVTLRMMTLKDRKITDVARLFGGQGTINVPSWAPDGKRFAFVSFAIVGE